MNTTITTKSDYQTLHLLGMFFTIPFGEVLFFFHTPIASALLTLLLPLFDYDRSRVFFLIILGAGSHIFADLFIKHFMAGIPLFFPFSMGYYSFGLIWPDQSYSVILVLLFWHMFTKVSKRILLSSS